MLCGVRMHQYTPIVEEVWVGGGAYAFSNMEKNRKRKNIGVRMHQYTRLYTLYPKPEN